MLLSDQTRRVAYIDARITELEGVGCMAAVSALPGTCQGCRELRDLVDERARVLAAPITAPMFPETEAEARAAWGDR